MTLTLFVALVLATWRLSSLLAYEDGPWDVLERLRYLSGVRYDPVSAPYGENTLAKGILCQWCNSVWCGLFLGVIAAIAGIVPLAYLLFLPLALSGGAILVQCVIERLEGDLN